MKLTLLERSLKLVAVVEDYHVGDFTIKGTVKSESSDQEYCVRVDLKRGIYECACVAWQAQPHLPCKHVGALLIRLRENLCES